MRQLNIQDFRKPFAKNLFQKVYLCSEDDPANCCKRDLCSVSTLPIISLIKLINDSNCFIFNEFSMLAEIKNGTQCFAQTSFDKPILGLENEILKMPR